jgi:Tol biopolymer transport system component
MNRIATCQPLCGVAFAALCLAHSACLSIPPATEASDGAPADATDCSFGPAEPLELVTGSVFGKGGSMTDDGLYLFLTSGSKLFRSSRTSLSAPWGSAEEIVELNDFENQAGSITADGSWFFFASVRAPDADVGLFKAHWDGGRFEVPEYLAINGDALDFHPSVTRDLLELYFVSNRNGQNSLYVARRAAATEAFGDPQPVSLSFDTSESLEASPWLSDDGLTLYFSSDRPGGQGLNDIWQATRPSRDEPFANPEPLEYFNSAEEELYFRLSPDGLEAIFSRTVDNLFRLMRATRPCVP